LSLFSLPLILRFVRDIYLLYSLVFTSFFKIPFFTFLTFLLFSPIDFIFALDHVKVLMTRSTKYDEHGKRGPFGLTYFAIYRPGLVGW